MANLQHFNYNYIDQVIYDCNQWVYGMEKGMPRLGHFLLRGRVGSKPD